KKKMLIGMIDDKLLAKQKVLGVLHLIVLSLFYYVTTVADPDVFYWIILLYSLSFAPTLALVNSVAFRQMGDTTKQFASIRVLGTVGWIVACWIITFIQGYTLS